MNYKEFFKDVKDNPHGSFTVEELYQAFRDRFMEEDCEDKLYVQVKECKQLEGEQSA